MVEMTAVFLPAEPNALIFGDFRLPVREAERRVVLEDVLVGDAFGFEEGADDLVAGARIDVVGAFEHEPLYVAALRAHEIFDGGDGLVVRHRAAVEYVVGIFLALVFERVEEETVKLFEHRQDRFARDRGPAAEHRCDLVLADQLARLFGEQRPVRGRVDHHRLNLLAEQPPLGVELSDLHQHHILEDRLADRHRARQRMEDADLDRIVRGDGVAARGRDHGCGESALQPGPARGSHCAHPFQSRFRPESAVRGCRRLGESLHGGDPSAENQGEPKR